MVSSNVPLVARAAARAAATVRPARTPTVKDIRTRRRQDTDVCAGMLEHSALTLSSLHSGFLPDGVLIKVTLGPHRRVDDTSVRMRAARLAKLVRTPALKLAGANVNLTRCRPGSTMHPRKSP